MTGQYRDASPRVFQSRYSSQSNLNEPDRLQRRTRGGDHGSAFVGETQYSANWPGRRGDSRS